MTNFREQRWVSLPWSEVTIQTKIFSSPFIIYNVQNENGYWLVFPLLSRFRKSKCNSKMNPPTAANPVAETQKENLEANTSFFHFCFRSFLIFLAFHLNHRQHTLKQCHSAVMMMTGTLRSSTRACQLLIYSMNHPTTTSME